MKLLKKYKAWQGCERASIIKGGEIVNYLELYNEVMSGGNITVTVNGMVRIGSDFENIGSEKINMTIRDTGGYRKAFSLSQIDTLD